VAIPPKLIDNAPWVHGDLIAVDSGEMGAGIQFYSRLRINQP